MKRRLLFAVLAAVLMLIIGCGETENAAQEPPERIDYAAAKVSYDGEYRNDGLFMAVLPCPEGYMEYAPEAVARHLSSYGSEMGVDYLSDENVQVGNPFTFANTDSDIFYFPVLRNGKIIYIVRVFRKSNGDYSAVSGEMLKKELNELAEKTDSETPLFLVGELNEGYDIVAYIGGERRVLETSPRFEDDVESPVEPAKLKVVCITDPCTEADFAAAFAAYRQ